MTSNEGTTNGDPAAEHRFERCYVKFAHLTKHGRWILRLILGLGVVVALSEGQGFAAPLEQVVEPKGLLLFNGLDQSVSLVYEHAGTVSNTANSNSSTNHLWEKYHAGTNFSITDPHLLNIQLTTDIMFDQEYTSFSNTGTQSSHGVQYQYSLVGTSFDNTNHPVTVTSVREINTIVSPFIPTYTVDSSVNGVNLVYQHLTLPFQLRYERRSLESSGLAQDYSTTTDSVQFSAQNTYRDISVTGLDLSVINDQRKLTGQDEISDKGYSLALNNNLAFDPLKKYILNSQLQLQSSTGGGIPQTALSLTEGLEARFGKSLQAALTYFYSYYKTLNLSNNSQVTSNNGINATIVHHLFSSLQTSLSGKVLDSQTLGGRETDYAGGAAMVYRKNLPAASNLTATVAGEHQVTDREVTESQITVRDELFNAVQQGDIISLKTAAKSYDVISITSRDHLITYVENRDYQVFPTLGQILIIRGGQIIPGSDILVTYVADVDPSIKFSTDTVSVNGNLSLFNNRYRIKGSMLRQYENRISGPATNVDLTNTKSDLVQFDALYPSNTLSATYARYEARTTQYTYLEGGWRFDRQFDLSSASFVLRDRYTMYDMVVLAPSYNENTFEVGAGYNRSLFSWLQSGLSMDYVDTRTTNDIFNKYLYVKATLQGRISKLFVSLTGQSILRIYGPSSLRNDYVRLEVKRYF